MVSETFANREVGARACREVLVACFRSHYPAQAPHQIGVHQTLLVNALGAIILIRYASSMREATDEQLMQRYAKGEAKAFDELYTRHRGPLYRYFIRQVNNPATANDLYQGAWEKIIQGRQKYRPTAPFTAWMYSLAHNHLVDYYRRLRPGDPLGTDDLSDNQPGPVQGVIEGEQNDQLRSGINALPEEQKNTLLLKLETGLKMEDIARVTGVSRETVKSRLRYAVNKLKRSLVE
jgi:RNA polymerase sigma factor (sigma-70 family)